VELWNNWRADVFVSSGAILQRVRSTVAAAHMVWKSGDARKYIN